MKRLLYLALLLIVPSIHAQIINANSCSQADVQAAFNAVTASTTTVNIPSCTASWTGQVLLNVPSSSTSLTIHGNSTTSGTCGPPATTCPPTDNTVIQDGDTADSNSLWIITSGSATSCLRFTGITLQGGTGGVKNNGALAIGGFTQCLRIDHNHFNGQTYSVSNNGNLVRTVGWIYGVADHNDFAMESIQNSISTWMDSYGNNAAGFGDNAWAAPTNFGGSNFFFLENNLFETPTTNKNGPPNDCSHGGRFVFRYNIMQGTALQTHPTGGSGRARGCRAWEIYNNSAVGVNSGGGALADFNFMFASSGTGLIWGNTITGTGSGTGSGYTNFTSIHSDRIDATTYTESPVPNGWGYCGPSSGLSGDQSPWDPNPTTTGYPCLDQPGTGIGDQLQGQFPNACDVTSGQCAIPNFSGSNTHQAHEPVYDWMNSWTVTSGAGGQYWSNSQPTVLSNNNDYYLWCNASAPTGCPSFTGAAGVGSGVLSSRPSTCTKGVAYWGTDTQTLYQCTATNTWATYYTPYTYPHPLVTGTPSASTPTFSPVAGTYTGTQSVVISAATGGVICYTTNGTAPHTNGATACSAGTLYSGAVSVAAGGTLEAVAGGTGFSDSAPGTAAYVIRTTASTPTFSPVAGTYAGMQSIILSSASSGATICYTTNGSTPSTNGTTGCTTGTVYSTAISVSSNETLKAVAGGSPFLDSSVASAAYVITTGAATPTFSPVAGTYSSTQSVTLATATGGAVICYTIDGSTPATNGSTGCTTGTLYGSAISVATSETIKAVAGGTGHADSSVGSAAYVINTNASVPTFSPVAGTYTSSQSVTLSTSSSGAVLCYTTNGATPATNHTTGCATGTLYTVAISVPSSVTLKAIAGGTGYNDSTVTTAIYTIRIAAAQPTFSPGAGTYTGMQSVTISTTSAGPFVICYNTTGSPVTDGNAGCTTGTIYTGPVSITSSQTLFAVVGGPGYNDSPVGSAAFVIRTQTQTPTFTPPAGPYVMPITATISVPSPDSAAPLTVCYAVSATCVPGSTGTPYTCASTPCNVNVNPSVSEQICATATTPGLSPSAVACSGLYTASAAATGDGRGVQTEPQYPAALFTGGCTIVLATQTVSSVTTLNLNPWNPTYSTQGSLGGSGGTSIEPASETLDTTLQTAINNTNPGGCVEVKQDTGGKIGLVEGKWAPVTTKGSGGGVTVILDPGITIFASRQAATYQPSDPSCGTLPTSGTGGTSCDPWITVTNEPGAAIMGGTLDGRCWDKFTGSGNGFCVNKLQTLCDTHGGGPWAGVTCPISRADHGIANGPNMMNWKGACAACNNVAYKTIFKDSGQFNFNIENGLSGFTAWGIGIYGDAEVSNTDGFDPAYCVTNVTLAFSFISTGDNGVAMKANSGKGGGCTTGNISLLNNQTGAGIGFTAGFETSSSSGPGINNVLVSGLVQNGGSNNPAQQVGFGINSGDDNGGLVQNVTFQNVCQTNETKSILLSSTSNGACGGANYPSYQGINIQNVTTLNGSSTGNSGSFTLNGYHSSCGGGPTVTTNIMGLTLNNIAANGSASVSSQYATVGGLNVSWRSSISGTGVTNNITNPGGNTPFPCTSTTWQPIHGDLSAQIAGQSLYSTFTTANSSQALKLEAVIRPTTAINTQEATALTQPVAFYDNGTLLGTAAIGGNGTYAFYSTTATNGSHTYTARYSGDSGYPGVVYNFGSVTVQVGSSAPTIVGPTQFQGTVVVQ